MKTEIKNFTESESIIISHGVHPSCGPLVTLVQGSGSMYFQFSCRANKAREMAESLLAAAEAIDPTLLEVAA